MCFRAICRKVILRVGSSIRASASCIATARWRGWLRSRPSRASARAEASRSEARAASSPHVDMAFVMALQSVRLVFVIALAPALTRLVVRFSPHLRQQPS